MIWLVLFLDLLTPVFQDAAVEISHFSFQRNREHHGGVWPDDLDGPPPMGEKLFAMAELLDEDELTDVQFWLVDATDRRVIAPLGFLRISERSFCGWATVPSEPFRVRAEGHYLDGRKFHVITALQTPVKRTLPPELPGGPADEKYRALTASPGPIPIPHARVTGMDYHLEGKRLVLEFAIDVSSDGGFEFHPSVAGATKFSARTLETKRYTRGQHLITLELLAEKPPKPGRYTVYLSRTDFVRIIRLP